MAITVDQFVNLNDQQLYQMAEWQTAVTSNKKSSQTNALIWAIPVVDSFSRAAFKEGSFGVKTGTFAKSMAGWAGVFALANVFNKVFDKTQHKFPKIKEFKEKHPILSTVVEWGSFWAVMSCAYKGIVAGCSKIAKKYPQKAENFAKFKNNMVNKLDNSFLNSKIYTPLAKGVKYLEKKFPTMASGVKQIFPLIAPLLLVTAVTRSLYVVNDVKDSTIRNFEHLKNTQNELRQKLINQQNFYQF